jgi:hypothetical protein
LDEQAFSDAMKAAAKQAATEPKKAANETQPGQEKRQAR